jgi:putative ABC transport system permease protein
MTWFGRFRRRAALDRDLDRELQDHLERRTQALIAAGLTPAQAHRQARVESGGAEQVKEAVRDVRGTRWAHDAAQDVRYAVRTLVKSPGLLAAAVLSMGLGIGANTAIFSLVDAVLLRSLPVSRPEELAVLEGGSWTNPIWEEVRRHAEGRFAGAFAWSEERLDLSQGGETDPVDALMVSGRFFETLGVQPALGRLLTIDDDRRGGGPDGPTVVISERFWERRFQRDPHVVGRPLAVSGVPFTVVGVVPARFLGPSVGRTFDIAAPIGTIDLVRPGDRESALDGRWTWWLNIMLRRHPGQSIEAATAALRGVQPQIRAGALPADGPPEARATFLADPLTLQPASTGLSELRRHYRQPLLALIGIVALVLLVACANVANLLLARAAARRHELSARLALGASHGRLVRQLLTESVVLAVPGALAGLALAVWGARFLLAQLATSGQPVALALPIDWRLLGFLTALTVLTAIGFGLVPAWRTRRLDAAEAMGHAAAGRITRRRAVSGPLVVGQIALSLVLVVAAGLFSRTFSSLATRDLGFRPDDLHVAAIEMGRIPAGERARIYEELAQAALAVPGVRAAGTSMIGPLSGAGWNTRVQVPGQPLLPGREAMSFLNAVTPGWFATYGIRMVAGRDFGPADGKGPNVGVVNQTFARRFFGAVSPVGRRVLLQGPGGQAEWEIIGVVEDAAYRGVRETFLATLYQPISASAEPPPFASLTVRTAPGTALGSTAALTEAIRRVDPTLAVTYQAMRTRLRDQLTEVRTVALLSGFFGALALLLAAIGLYGVTSYGVNERRREIGIRLTLGAGRAAAERFVLGGVARLVAIGVALGVAASLALSPLVRTLLYRLEPRDPLTMTAAAACLAVVGLLAGWLPARRAARIDPAQVLREG